MRRLLPLLLVCLLVGLAGGQISPLGQQKPILVVDAGGHSDIVRHVMFTPTGKFAITVGHDKTVRIWDLSTGGLTRTMRLPSGPAEEGIPLAAATASTGYIAVGGMPLGKGKFGVPIQLLNPRTGRADKVFKGHTNVITALAFSRDGRFLASGSSDKTVRIWDTRTGKSQVLSGHLSRIRTVAWSPDGKRLASSAGDGTARIWSLTTGKTETTLNAQGILTLAWSPDGKTIATATADGKIVTFDPAGKQQKSHAVGDVGYISRLAFSPDSKELLYTGMGKDEKYPACIIDVGSGAERLRVLFHNNSVVDGVFSPDGKQAATTGGNDNETYVWDVTDGKLLHKLVGKGKTPWAVGWAPDGKSIAWGTVNKGLGKSELERSFHVEDLEFGSTPTAEFSKGLTSHDGWSLEHADGMQVVAKQGDKVIHQLSTEIPKEPVYSFSFLHDGRAVLGGAYGLYLVDPRANKVIRKFRGHTSQIFALAPSPDGKLLVSSANDMTVRIWDPEKEDPLLSCFFTDSDWVVWTPEGYFAASPGGEELMGWQINHSADALASFHPAARFRNSLYLPEMLKKVVAERSVARALLAVGKKPGDLVNVARALPPQITITSPVAPKEGALVVSEGKPIEIEATAKSVTNYAITSLRLMVDGRPYKGQESVRRLNPSKMTASEKWTVELPPGTYSVAVQAQTLTSKGLSPLLEVNVGGKEPGPANLYVLAIGINEYPGSLKLNYAAPDADAITDALKKYCASCFGKVEVKLIKDRQASKGEIMKGINWMKATITPRDVGVIFFSGHGGRDKNGNMYLLPVEANPFALASTCIPGDWLKNAMGDIPGRLIAVLDACHSGSVVEGKRQALFDDLVRDLVSDDYGVIVMCASLGREYALEGSDVKAGYFTTALIEGLSGKADFNNDGEIFLNELDGYAARRVKELTRGMQNPTTAKPPNVAWFPLVRR